MKKIFLGLICSFLISIGGSNAFLWEFVNLNVQGLADNFSSIHFMGPGNSFGGAFFWLPPKSLPLAQSISIGTETVNCHKMVRGLYYNNQRGERIWPLDPYTLAALRQADASYSGLELVGGLYTTCDGDPYDIVGQLTFVLHGDYSYLMAGLEVDYANNWLTGNFKHNFQYFNNELPLGYIVDNIGGIGFVGGLLTGNNTSGTGHECLICLANEDCSDYPRCEVEGCSGDSIDDFFVYSGNQILADEDCSFSISGITVAGGPEWGISIQGKIGLTQTLADIERQSMLGTQEKAILLSTPTVTSATLINQSRKKTQELCRGLPNLATASLLNYDGDVFCYDYPFYQETNLVDIDLGDPSKYQGKTFLVKNANVLLENGMQSVDNYLDMFVDNGNVFLENNPTNLPWFDGEGYFTTDPAEQVAQGFFLQGNIIINGLLLAQNGAIGDFHHKLYFHGKIHSLNTPVSPSEGRILQIETLFGSDLFNDRINLQDTFSRYCNPVTGSGTDGVACSDDPLAESPLVIIDQTFPSRVLGN